MDGILTSKITSQEDLIGHSCGNASVDSMIKNSFLPHLFRQQDTYKITYKNRIVGFYAIKIRAVECSDSSAEFAEYYYTEPSFGCIYVKYLGVDSDCQGFGIGTWTLKHIIISAYTQVRDLPIRLVVFDALREKVPFYLKRGFQVLREEEYQGNKETVKMYFDLMPDSEFNEVKELAEQT